MYIFNVTLNKKNMLYFFLCFTVALTWISTSFADTEKEEYFKAEACYKQLRNSPKKQKYRDNWLVCIEKFKMVYKQAPSGPWAAAGLYMSGKLYAELYKRSYKQSDKNEAIDSFERITKRFPKSRYRARATQELADLSKKNQSPSHVVKKEPDNQISQTLSKTPVPQTESKEEPVSYEEYLKAEACYKQLIQSDKKQKYRDNWLVCIEKFKMAYKHAPSDPWAAASLYMSGKLYAELYKRSYKQSDKNEAIDSFERIVTRFPKNEYKEKAEMALADFSKKKQTSPPVVKKESDSQFTKALPETPVSQIEPEKEPASYSDYSTISGSGYSTISGLRFWSNPGYTRIVIDADEETSYVHNLLKQDPSINKPQRLYIDLDKSRLHETTNKTIPINDNLLIDVRAAQYKKDVVRVVIDIKSFKTFNIFSLKNPFRIVIDVWGSDLEKEAAPFVVEKDAKHTENAIAKQLALGVSRIVIDPGHGGHDYGAPGYYKGVHEKDVVLQIAKKLKNKIPQQLGCDVIMTRSTDTYLTLEERTAIANTSNADLFISIHSNAAKDKNAYGLETYFLNLATDDSAILVAARENATSAKNISDLQTILTDLMQNAKINESSRLADYIQKSMFVNLNKKYSDIKNKGVKQAPFYVLLGAQMPSILIETSFISNPRECKRLTDGKYQEELCNAIVKGVETYIREINPTVLLKNTKKKTS